MDRAKGIRCRSRSEMCDKLWHISPPFITLNTFVLGLNSIYEGYQIVSIGSIKISGFGKGLHPQEAKCLRVAQEP